jgi:DNA polymerase-4
MARCIFRLDLDALFASVEQAIDPELKGKPVIVGRDPERRGVVASASYEAGPFDIRAVHEWRIMYITRMKLRMAVMT